MQISTIFVAKGPIDNKRELARVMAWRRTGDTPSPEPMMTQYTCDVLLIATSSHVIKVLEINGAMVSSNRNRLCMIMLNKHIGCLSEYIR